MPKITFNQEVRGALDSFLPENPQVEQGRAFGLPAYYVNGKMFAAVYEDGATVKVPAETAAELLGRDGFQELRPMEKRAMKNWVLIKREDPRDHLGDREIFESAREYVYVLSKEEEK